MNEDEATEPTPASLAEMPEIDFSEAIRPNHYANLRGDFEPAVFLDRQLWEHFGNEQRVIEVLRMLVDLGRGRDPSHVA